MANKLAILQMADTPQIESTAVMLRHAGYEVAICGPRLQGALKAAGCDTVLSVNQMYSLGYDKVASDVLVASPEDMDTCDLFVEIKVRNVPRIISRWPRLAGRVAWWRVNGAQPEVCPKGGDEVNLPCPVITACLWYGTARYATDATGRSLHGQPTSDLEHLAGRPMTIHDWRGLWATYRPNDAGLAYTFWPPYPRSAEYDRVDRSTLTRYREAYCLCHNVRAWGYGEIVDNVARLGTSMYGNGCPHGQVSHAQVPGITAEALCLVHLKSVDCPGWALYEAMLAGCPVVTGRLLNSRMLAYSLLEDGVTCLEFGVPASLEYGRGDPMLDHCLHDIAAAMEYLKVKENNLRVGEAGRRRLNELMWRPERDGDSFIEFMRRNFK